MFSHLEWISFRGAGHYYWILSNSHRYSFRGADQFKFKRLQLKEDFDIIPKLKGLVA
jgi:hypothetical protein